MFCFQCHQLIFCCNIIRFGMGFFSNFGSFWGIFPPIFCLRQHRKYIIFYLGNDWIVSRFSYLNIFPHRLPQNFPLFLHRFSINSRTISQTMSSHAPPPFPFIISPTFPPPFSSCRFPYYFPTSSKISPIFGSLGYPIPNDWYPNYGRVGVGCPPSCDLLRVWKDYCAADFSALFFDQGIFFSGGKILPPLIFRPPFHQSNQNFGGVRSFIPAIIIQCWLSHQLFRSLPWWGRTPSLGKYFHTPRSRKSVGFFLVYRHKLGHGEWTHVVVPDFHPGGEEESWRVGEARGDMPNTLVGHWSHKPYSGIHHLGYGKISTIYLLEKAWTFS